MMKGVRSVRRFMIKGALFWRRYMMKAQKHPKAAKNTWNAETTMKVSKKAQTYLKETTYNYMTVPERTWNYLKVTNTHVVHLFKYEWILIVDLFLFPYAGHQINIDTFIIWNSIQITIFRWICIKRFEWPIE